jgi:ATP-binding cassette, subfamily B, bacterial
MLSHNPAYARFLPRASNWFSACKMWRRTMVSREINLFRLLIPHWKRVGIALLAVLGITAADVLQPWPLKIVLDYVLAGHRMPGWLVAAANAAFKGNKNAILDFAIVAVGVITIVDSVSSYLESYMMTSVGQWVAHDIRRTVYHHVERLSLGYYDQKQTGDLITRMTNDIDAIQDVITSALMDTLIDVLTIGGMLGVMLYLNWRFSLIALGITPLLFAVVYKYKRRIKEVSRSARKKQSEVLSTIQEVFSSIRVVKAFGREDFEEKRFEKGSREQVQSALEARAIKSRLSPLVDIIVASGTCLVLWYGAWLVLSGALTSGALVVFMLYLRKLYSPLKDLAKMTNTFSRAAVGLEAIEEVMREKEQIPDVANAVEARNLAGRIEFDHVDFGYSPGRLALSNVTFTIEPGQIVAFVGPTGAGKTTIINLIPRFYDVLSGHVRIDGEDVRNFQVDSLRRNIAFVLQETILFRAPIWQNIAYGKLDATPDEIVRAARLANADEFIMKMPQGYDTLVGERGVTLSGGQRQRIAIARAIIRDAPILIMDEPTTGLDAASEELVLEALNNLMAGRTCIINAHRLATIRRADVIFVLRDGEIIETGTHEQLLANQGLYRKLYDIQFHDRQEPAEHEELIVRH